MSFLPFIMDSQQQYICGNPVEVISDSISPLDFASAKAREKTAQNIDDPFYICDIGTLARKHEEWVSSLPRVQPYYAVKCNNNSVIVSTLAQLGANFDCASKGEIDQVLALGVEPSRIIFANPCKTASHIRHAESRGVKLMTFDNDQELTKVKRLFPEAELVLRIAVSDPTAVCQLNMKFGCEPTASAAALLSLATSLGVKVVGISFHVGSGARDPSAFAIGIAHARRLFDVGKQLGHNMHVLDLGGGYPGYENQDITFQKIALTINIALSLHFPLDLNVHVIAEPGRYYVASAFTLCANVIAKTRVSANKITGRDEDADQIGFMYYINDGVYGSFNCILFDHVVPLGRPLTKSSSDSLESWCSIWGPTCDSMDCIYKSYRISELKVADWIVFDNMGAYTMAAASDFNGFQKTFIHYIVRKHDWWPLNKNFVMEEDSGCMSDDSGVPVVSDDDTCSVISSCGTDSLSSCASLANILDLEPLLLE